MKRLQSQDIANVNLMLRHLSRFQFAPPQKNIDEPWLGDDFNSFETYFSSQIGNLPQFSGVKSPKNHWSFTHLLVVQTAWQDKNLRKKQKKQGKSHQLRQWIWRYPLFRVFHRACRCSSSKPQRGKRGNMPTWWLNQLTWKICSSKYWKKKHWNHQYFFKNMFPLSKSRGDRLIIMTFSL